MGAARVIVSTVLALALLGIPEATVATGDTATTLPLRQVQTGARVEKASGQRAIGAYREGEVLVEFRRGVSRATGRRLHARLGARVERRIGSGRKVEVVRLPRGLEVPEAVRRYERSGLVEYAEPNFYRFPALTPDDSRVNHQWALNNTGQPHPRSGGGNSTGTAGADINAFEAWDVETGDDSVVIAVIDTGVDVSHPDLAPNLWANAAELGGEVGKDDDNNGFVDDIHGWDFAENNNSLLGPSNAANSTHGTYVAGIIAGATNNGTGIAGVCGGDGAAQPGCAIMVLKFMDDVVIDGERVMVGTVADEIEAVTYARAMGAHVINASFGSYEFSAAERRAYQQAGANQDILTVAAAGNDSLDNDMPLALFDGNDIVATSPTYPASYTLPHILTVAASTHQDRYGYLTGCFETGSGSRDQCAFTNFGRESVDVAAPGTDVLSTSGASAYEVADGTSAAAPHVSGVAGLLRAQDGNRTALQVKSIILQSANRSSELPLFDTMHSVLFALGVRRTTGPFTRTRGRLDALNALTLLTAPPPLPAPTDGNIDGAVRLKSSQRGKLRWPGDVNDVFKKRLVKGRRYRFVLSVPRRRDFDLYLWKNRTMEIWQWSKIGRASTSPTRGGDEAFSFRARATGTYFVHVSTFFSAGRYTLRFRCVSC